MTPPGASRKTTSGNVGRRTTRSSAATNGAGDGQEIAPGQEDSVTSDAEQEEQPPEVADDDGTVMAPGTMVRQSKLLVTQSEP